VPVSVIIAPVPRTFSRVFPQKRRNILVRQKKSIIHDRHDNRITRIVRQNSGRHAELIQNVI
jgi:hypothetical protein